MRLLFFILLLANFAIFGYFFAQPLMHGDSAIARAPLKPDSIRVRADAAKAAERPSSGTSKAICLEWSGLNEANFGDARDALDKLQLKDKLVLPSASDFWVYVPPLKSLTEAEKKLREVKDKGVEDGKVVEEAGQWRFAISLAAFPSEEEAQFYLKQLRDKGVRSARVLERQRQAYSLTIVGVDEKLRAQIEKIKADFDQTELKTVDCKIH
jgi:hypothetical protein